MGGPFVLALTAGGAASSVDTAEISISCGAVGMELELCQEGGEIVAEDGSITINTPGPSAMPMTAASKA